MEDHILEKSIYTAAMAFEKEREEIKKSESYRLEVESGETTRLADPVHNMYISRIIDDLRKMGYRSVEIWGTRETGTKSEGYLIGIALDTDGSIVAYDPTIAQTGQGHNKIDVRILRARNSIDLEAHLTNEYGGTWMVKDAVDRANNLNMANPPIRCNLGGREVELDNYFMYEPLPESEIWLVENPDLPNLKNFREALQKVLPYVLQDCHPLLKNSKGIIQFVKHLKHHISKGGEQMGYASVFASPDGKEILPLIYVSLNSLRQRAVPESSWEISALGIILHELYEIDLNLKSHEVGKPIEKHPFDENYAYTDHELIPNIKALRTIKYFFGDDYTFDGFTSGLIIKMPEDLKLWGNLDKLHTGLDIIQNRGRLSRDVVSYLHKDDHGLEYLVDTIQSKLKEQRKTEAVRLGVVVGTGALLSIAPDVDVDAWLVLDNNAFVLEWSQRTVTALRNTNCRADYERLVYKSQQAEEARKNSIDPNVWLDIEKKVLGKLHFLNSDNRFTQAKQKLTKTPVLFCQGDLSNRQYMEELAHVLQSHNAEIAFANLTDVLEFAPPIGDVIDLLPFRTDAVIVHATRFRTTNNHPTARVSYGVQQYKEIAIAEKNLFYQEWNSRR